MFSHHYRYVQRYEAHLESPYCPRSATTQLQRLRYLRWTFFAAKLMDPRDRLIDINCGRSSSMIDLRSKMEAFIMYHDLVVVRSLFQKETTHQRLTLFYLPLLLNFMSSFSAFYLAPPLTYPLSSKIWTLSRRALRDGAHEPRT